MRLIDVYDREDALHILWQLMEEREAHVNISHRGMPTWLDHQEFVASRPYKGWWIIENDDGRAVGACYLSKQNEIGIFILHAYRSFGYGEAAVMQLIAQHPGTRLLANIAPSNLRSIEFFERLGFRLLQQTFVLETAQ
jgi:RimJ/RimL family protein N-acetyltransferase